MKKSLLVLLSSIFLACTQLIDKPKNLIEKKTMSAVIAEFALNEQIATIGADINLDNATRYTLKQHKIKGNDFVESYKYYTATGEIEGILENAEDIILNKDPAAKPYLEKKIKENKNAAALAK